MDVPWCTVYTTVFKVQQLYPYKIKHAQELQVNDPVARETFTLEFRAQIEFEEHWSWNILWIDEEYFYLNGDGNTHNCKIWTKQTPYIVYPDPLYSSKVTIWCGMIANFTNEPFLFEEQSIAGPITCTIIAACLASIVRLFVVRELQQSDILDSAIFMQNGCTFLHVSHSLLSNISRMNGL